jgi:hypothetical protein
LVTGGFDIGGLLGGLLGGSLGGLVGGAVTVKGVRATALPTQTETISGLPGTASVGTFTLIEPLEAWLEAKALPSKVKLTLSQLAPVQLIVNGAPGVPKSGLALIVGGGGWVELCAAASGAAAKAIASPADKPPMIRDTVCMATSAIS